MHDIDFIRDLRQHAEAYYNLGFNITGIKENLKAPYHRWEQYQWKRQSEHDAFFHKWFQLSGIGVITGINSLFCLDFDKCDLLNVPFFLEMLGLPPDYKWVVVSGSGKGFHFWFTSKQLQSRLRSFSSAVQVYVPKMRGHFGQLELRLNCHVVMPPSKSVNGRQYEFLHRNDLTERPTEIDYEIN